MWRSQAGPHEEQQRELPLSLQPSPPGGPDWEEKERDVQAWLGGLLGAPQQRLIWHHQQERGKCCKKGPFTHPRPEGI